MSIYKQLDKYKLVGDREGERRKGEERREEERKGEEGRGKERKGEEKRGRERRREERRGEERKGEERGISKMSDTHNVVCQLCDSIMLTFSVTSCLELSHSTCTCTY